MMLWASVPYKTPTKKIYGESQDGGVGRHWVSISPQLGCLLAAGGGLWCPRRWEEPQSEPVGHRGTERGGEVEARQDQRLWGQGYQERQAGGTLQEEQERSGGRSLGPLGLESLLSSQAGTPCPKAPPGHVGPGSIRGRLGRWGEAGRRGPLGGAGEERRVIVPPTRARGACWAAFQSPLQAAQVLEGIGGRPGRSGEAGGRSHPGGAEGECPPHSGTGSLLSSQADPLPSKAPSRLHESLGA